MRGVSLTFDSFRNPPPPPPPAANAPKHASQIVSHAWGSYPQMEMYSAPKRHNTHPGHGYRRAERNHEDFNTRAQGRIARRLSDVSLLNVSFGSSLNFVDGVHGNLVSEFARQDQSSNAYEWKYL